MNLTISSMLISSLSHSPLFAMNANYKIDKSSFIKHFSTIFYVHTSLYCSNSNFKYLLSSLLKLIISQRLIKGTDEKLVLLPEVMVVDNVVAGCIRKEKFSVSELEDAIQSNLSKGNVSLINALAELYVNNKISLEQAKSQLEEKNLEVLNRTIMQMKMKKM